jgi:hypothetical protein
MTDEEVAVLKLEENSKLKKNLNAQKPPPHFAKHFWQSVRPKMIFSCLFAYFLVECLKTVQ